MSGTVLISGGTGLIGKLLVRKLLDNNYSLKLLTRSLDNKKNSDKITYVKWDIKNSDVLIPHIEKSDVVIHLAGEPIAAKRWTPKQKEILYSSRIDTSKSLMQAISNAKHKPSLYMNASAIGYYGFDNIGTADESTQKGNGFLSDLCEAWENENNKIRELNIRQVGIRIGIVLSKDGGALPKIALPYKLFVGGTIGPGNQWIPFIHIEDLVNIFLFAIENNNVEGYINGVGPQAITMKELGKAISRVLKRPNLFYVPEFMIKLIFGESAIVITGGKNVIPKKLLSYGFTFKYPDIYSALNNIYNK